MTGVGQATPAPEIRVGIIGAGWMGRVHARSYERARHHDPSLPHARLVLVAETAAPVAADLVARHGGSAVSDWRELVACDEIDAVSVTAPNALHRELGVAVAEAGKHLWIEKPVGLDAVDARAVRDAVRANGVVGCVGFNYRHVPAVQRARALIAEGAIGSPVHARFQLLTDYAAHPGGPLSWRFTLAQGGHGVLGDLASHGVDLVRFLLGDLQDLVAVTGQSIPARPIVESTGHYGVVDLDRPGLRFGPVENEDSVTALLRLRSGAVATLACDRAAVGEQNSYGFSIHGTRGLVQWDFRRPGELHVSSGEAYASQSTSRLLSGPEDGAYGLFQPGTGIAMGYDDTKVVEAMGFLGAIDGRSVELPDLDDAVASAEALDAIVRSAAAGAWESV